MSIILAGPWVGEFGWELFCWQAYLRYISCLGNKIVVVSRKDSYLLYKDFCYKFIDFDPISKECDAYKCNNMTNDFSDIYNSCKFDEYYDPRKGLVYYSGDKSLCKNFYNQTFVKYGKVGTTKAYDIILHARSSVKCGTHFRNWGIEKWNDLVGLLKNDGFSIASVGTISDALPIEKTDNLLGADLDRVTNIMANSGIIIGPSSGPIHLASLCGLKQVVWSEPKNKKKYLETWNPFKTKVAFYDKDWWNPEVNVIYGFIRNIM